LRRARRPSGLCAAALVFAVSAHSAAFCLTRTCDPTKGDCKMDSHGCLQLGLPLFWPNSCVSYDVQKDGSKLRSIDYDTLHTIVGNCFSHWLNADCGKGMHPSIHLADYGPVDCAKPEYNKTEPNTNVITFHDSTWPYTNTADTIALTTVFFNGDTGEIYDSNVEINSYADNFTQGSPPGEYDLNAVLTHEFGHFLGLSHSDIPTATMYLSYMPNMATLAPDDVSGICTSLPPTRSVTSSDCTPRHGFSGECGKPETGCCATAIGSSASTNQTLGLFAFGLGLCAWTGRLRFRRSARAARS
jgi:Matrixin